MQIKSLFKLSVLILFVGVLQSCSFKSNVGIPAQQQFLLGEDEPGAFRADLTNNGDALVIVQEQDNQGNVIREFELEAGASKKVRIEANHTAVLKNPNNEEVIVRAILSEAVEGMRYTPLGK